STWPFGQYAGCFLWGLMLFGAWKRPSCWGFMGMGGGYLGNSCKRPAQHGNIQKRMSGGKRNNVLPVRLPGISYGDPAGESKHTKPGNFQISNQYRHRESDRADQQMVNTLEHSHVNTQGQQ
ncbi:MAG: hypothetical protein PHU95_03365, partial [Candidatus Thermoplasmatota archaeon]|nr:hypothetical protein [Candidatus Thermoplasmatota archaeon]